MSNRSEATRPNAETLLSRLQESTRARLRIYLGAAPGVGKTCQMLDDAHLLRKQGFDVVVGLVETFDRVETAARIGDLAVIPRKKIEYRNVILEEMDLAAIIKRKPEICLVDELAHSNVPGSKHHKRFEDILDILDAGIHVMTTVNVQHLETLNDFVAVSAGIKVRETVPDAFLKRADEIVYVDITMEELRTRLAQGKVYQREKVEQALNNFFRKENLTTLREMALRTVAEEVSSKAAQYRKREGLQPATIPEKVMVCMSSNQTAQKLIRAGARIAGRLGARWYAVYVETPQESDRRIKPDDAKHLKENIQLAEQLGATVVRLTTKKVADGLINFARREGITHVIFGQSARTRWDILFKGSIINRFLDEVREAAVQIIPVPHNNQKLAEDE